MDQSLVDRLSTLGRALGNTLRVRVAAEFIARVESSPVEVAESIGESLGSVSYHVRVLEDLGFLELRRVIPVRGALQHVYGVEPSLRSAFPATARALNQRLDPSTESVPDAQLDQFASVLPMGPSGTLDAHRESLAKFGWALSHDLRIRILDQLLTRREASTRVMASALGEPRALVGRHVRHLADVQLVKPSRATRRQPTHEERWTVGPEIKKALRGLGDYLALRDAGQGETQINGNGASA